MRSSLCTLGSVVPPPRACRSNSLSVCLPSSCATTGHVAPLFLISHTHLRRSSRPPPSSREPGAVLGVGRGPRTVRETGVASSAVQDSRGDGRTHGVRGTRPTRHGRNAGGHAFRQRWTCRGSARGWRSGLRSEVRFRGVWKRRRGAWTLAKDAARTCVLA